MKTLVVKQLRKDGVQKVWKVKPSQSPCTFGTSRISGVCSVDQALTAFEGVFQLTEKGWLYIDVNPGHVEGNKTCQISKETQIKFEESTINFEILEKNYDHIQSFENFGSAQLGDKTCQLFIITYQGRFIRSEILEPTEIFQLSEVTPTIKVPSQKSTTWVKQVFENYQVQQRTVNLEDASQLSRMSKKDFIDEEAKKPLVIAFSMALVLALLFMLVPKRQQQIVANIPKEPQKMLVKIDQLKNRKQAEKKAAQITEQTEKKMAAGGGGKVGGLLKSFSAGRISNLVGKVSAGVAASKNIIVQQGVVAGSGPSGRALSALGKQNGSGKNWSAESNGKGISVNTVGTGGGRSLAGLGGLAAGRTGIGGVGLIEDEGEVSGGLDRDIIAEYIKKQIGHILACYERQLSARKDLGGKVSVKFTISGKGSVETQNITESTMKDSTVEGCILNRVAKWNFPAPTGGTKVIVTYPFLFKSTN
jgi:TonB family protein